MNRIGPIIAASGVLAAATVALTSCSPGPPSTPSTVTVTSTSTTPPSGPPGPQANPGAVWTATVTATTTHAHTMPYLPQSNQDALYLSTLAGHQVPMLDDEQQRSLIDLGQSVCAGFAAGATRTQIVQTIVNATTVLRPFADEIVGTAASVYCQEYSTIATP